MKIKTIRAVSIVLLFCMCVGIFSACSNDPQDQPVTEPGEMISVIADKKSDYVIVYGATDEIGKTLADELCSVLYKLYGVSLPIRTDAATHEHEILVGMTSRAASAEADSRLENDKDFFIGCINGSVVFHAKNATAMKKMMITLRDGYFKDQTDGFSIPDNESYLYSAHRSDRTEIGAVVNLLQSGKTDYSIIINETDDNNLDCERVARYVQSSMQKQGIDIEIYEDFEDYADNTDYEFVIGYASIDRPEVQNVRRALLGSDDFVLTCSGTKIFLLATDVNALIRGAEYFVTQWLPKTRNGNLSLRECDEYRYALNGRSYQISATKLAELYQTVLKRYPTLYEVYFRTGTISDDSKRDQKLIEALVERMENAAVFCVGSSSALYNGMIHKLNPEDYAQTATVIDGKIYIPTHFANSYFGTSFETQGYKTVELNALAEKTQSTLYYDAATGLVILTPPNVASFAEDTAVSGGYNNAAYRARMLKFFQSTETPEPSNNTEQSRVVIDTPENYFPYPSYDYTQITYTVCYSPSILTVNKADSTVLYASYELSTLKNGEELSTVTVVQTSTDGGSTWQELTRINYLRWAELFLVENNVYLMGSTINQNKLRLCKLETDGSVTSKDLFDIGSGIMQPLVANGILYVPTDFGMLSVPVNVDLFEASNWTVTNNPNDLVSREWFNGLTGKTLGNPATGLGSCALMEANAVVGPDGEIYVIYRIESHPNPNYAVMFKLSADRTTLALLSGSQSLISLPTTISRFTIKYDAKSKLYVCLSNLYTVDGCDRARNVLGLSVSSDLRNWRTVDTLLVDREMMNAEASCWAHAFQYPDFDFDGEDLVVVIREATGYTNNFHDGKYCTFYRVSNFREMISD